MMKSFMTDTVTLRKQDGREIQNIKASVQSSRGKIYIDDGSLPLEEGDRIIRTINGNEENYLVIDRGYFAKALGINAHYQAEVKKESRIETQQTPSIVYNLNGPNSRVNIHSSDSSTNVVNTNSEQLFDKLRQALQEGIIDQQEKENLISKVDELEKTNGTPKFLSSYQAFIQSASNHMTVITPFIPALTQLLGGS